MSDRKLTASQRRKVRTKLRQTHDVRLYRRLLALLEFDRGTSPLPLFAGLKLSADNEDLDDPLLETADGRLIDTWREGYPYAERMPRAEYDMHKRLLLT